MGLFTVKVEQVSGATDIVIVLLSFCAGHKVVDGTSYGQSGAGEWGLMASFFKRNMRERRHEVTKVLSLSHTTSFFLPQVDRGKRR